MKFLSVRRNSEIFKRPTDNGEKESRDLAIDGRGTNQRFLRKLERRSRVKIENGNRCFRRDRSFEVNRRVLWNIRKKRDIAKRRKDVAGRVHVQSTYEMRRSGFLERRRIRTFPTVRHPNHVGQFDALRLQKQKLRSKPGSRGETDRSLSRSLLSTGFLSSVLHSLHHFARLGGQSVVLRRLSKHASENTKLQLLPGRPGHRRLWLLGHFAFSLVEQHARMEGVQQRGLVRNVGLRERRLQLFERLVDRCVHGGEIHSCSVPSTQTSYMHYSQGKDHRAGVGDFGIGQSFLLLCHGRSDQQGRRRLLRSQGRILGDDEDNQHNRQHRQSNRAARTYHRHEHYDHEELVEVQQTIQAVFDHVHGLPEQRTVRHQSESDSGEWKSDRSIVRPDQAAGIRFNVTYSDYAIRKSSIANYIHGKLAFHCTRYVHAYSRAKKTRSTLPTVNVVRSGQTWTLIRNRCQILISIDDYRSQRNVTVCNLFQQLSTIYSTLLSFFAKSNSIAFKVEHLSVRLSIQVWVSPCFRLLSIALYPSRYDPKNVRS